ncbi:MAG: hypothetical protein K6B45_00005, partial [Bacteroidaceae bacterium]|nr:hypothetical protein [Bacteroidaceae bacterium]
LTITGGTIKSSVFGGGEFGAVAGHQMGDATKSTEIIITGGTIGTAIKNASGYPQYTFGSVYGGGMGTEDHFVEEDQGHGGDVHGNTWVTIGNADHAPDVLASVYGGGKMAAVDGNTNVSIVNGTIGLNKVRQDDGYVLFGGITMGNVFGGGKGLLGHTLAGVVKGNTNVSITGGNIYHNVYGGGALASVGTFTVADGVDPSYIPKDIPYGWTAGGGATNISITGGNIGINGRDNGMVFGSSRGDIAAPEGDPAIDPYDKLAWVENSNVTIGTSGSTNLASPHIAGSVYGGGENGHNEGSTAITVYSGTIGITDTNDRWYSFSDNAINALALTTRGNVYGGGCGTDTYTSGGVELHNPKSGMVAKNTEVNILGGHVGHSVYGGGSMGSVGTISNAADTLATATSTTKHTDLDNSFGLSWPYKFVFAENTGKATVNITGGHIGTHTLDGGDIYGSARGEAGDRYATMHLAYVGESEVNINYSSVPEESAIPNITTDFTIPCITGSVHGSGENGFVYEDTHVTLNNGLIGHSLYGAGKGKGTYQVTLNRLVGSGTYTDDIYSLIAGKVFGNTYVTMNNGRVLRNVYGGGNMGSVGKGNYASGADDYYTAGYGETLTGNLWDNVSDDSQAFLNSGKTTVKVFNGTVGYVDSSNPANSMKNNLPYGNVFGGSAGEAAPNILEDNHYLDCPAFFSGYVNETDVTIGGYRCTTPYEPYAAGDLITPDAYSALSNADKANWTLVGPTIYASVYGGGQDGHVRRDTKVNVYSGTIGLPYTAENKTLLHTEDVNADQWLHRGNVYGAGSGISKYKFDFDGDGDTDDEGLKYGSGTVNEQDYSTSAGSVTRFTEVNVKGGTVYRNVYGGGSLASVGPPTIPPARTDLAYKKGDATHGVGWQSMCTVNVSSIIGAPSDYDSAYGGNVFGASRGMESLDAESFGSVMWTIVNILNGADIKGNVFGGGDAGMVKRDTEVNVGGTAE